MWRTIIQNRVTSVTEVVWNVYVLVKVVSRAVFVRRRRIAYYSHR
jgi:hypothetical protein